ncbi:RbsD/FucU family protein [Streptomyces albicerus]|uniref:RbsD/FucU family protein n=1 Tax=Streptomyces albicerus TaxID=2569859 RepID=UPI00124BB411|nr:RbsD/FucU domain-containing protein [Streptomyces albicerus]
MLKAIPPRFTPDLLWAIAAMGHGDRIAIVDANYPAHALHTRVLPLAGIDTVQAGRMVTALLPIDDFVEPAAFWMSPDGRPDENFEVHALFRDAVQAAEGRAIPFASLERSAFYAEARGAFAVLTTADLRPFSCFLLTKGVVRTTAPPKESP